MKDKNRFNHLASAHGNTEDQGGWFDVAAAWTNSGLLKFASLSFFLFVVAEFAGAYFGNSLSLFGDACAMLVDVFTYLANLYAEHAKERFAHDKSCQLRCSLEVFIPAAAIVTLLVITGLVVWEAIGTVWGTSEEENVRLSYLYLFAMLNFVIDAACVFAFVQRGSAVLYEAPKFPAMNMDVEVHSDDSGEFGHLEDDFQEPVVASPAMQAVKNLNMRSALTHIGGDTLRTLSVLIAAVVASVSGVNVDVCDAWAALAVSVTIVIAVIPLAVDIARSAGSIWRQHREMQAAYSPLESEDTDDTMTDSRQGYSGSAQSKNDNSNGGRSNDNSENGRTDSGHRLERPAGYGAASTSDEEAANEIFEFSENSQLSASPRENSFNL